MSEPVDAASASQAAFLEELRAFMEEGIPFNVFLGIRVPELGVGTATLVLPFRPELVGNPFVPALHGGTISALADTAGGAAVFSATDAGDRVSTIDVRIDYLRPAALVDCVAVAEVVRLGGRVGVARIRVWQQPEGPNVDPAARTGVDEAGRLQIAEATGVYAIHRRR